MKNQECNDDQCSFTTSSWVKELAKRPCVKHIIGSWRVMPGCQVHECFANRAIPRRRDGNGTGRGQRMGLLSLPQHGFVLSYPCHASHDGEKFLTPSASSLGAPPHLVKLYFLLIFPTTSIIFLMKPISLIKIYLKLQLNLSHQIKSIFRKKKNWIIYPIV